MMQEIKMERTRNRKEKKPDTTSPAGLRSRPSHVNLAAAVELNFAEWLRLQERPPWVEFHDDGDALRLFAGDTWPRNYRPCEAAPGLAFCGQPRRQTNRRDNALLRRRGRRHL